MVNIRIGGGSAGWAGPAGRQASEPKVPEEREVVTPPAGAGRRPAADVPGHPGRTPRRRPRRSARSALHLLSGPDQAGRPPA
jgi:hypothetical protein